MTSVGSEPAWWRRPESEDLEYKDARALDHPEGIVRAVVAIANRRDGGWVVIGIADDLGVHGVADAERQRDRLQRILLDRVVPRVPEADVHMETVPGGTVLTVRIPASSTSRLHAERLASGALGFWVRAGATTVALSYEEVVARLVPAEPHPLPPWYAELRDREKPVLSLLARPYQDLAEARFRDLEAVFETERARARIGGHGVLPAVVEPRREHVRGGLEPWGPSPTRWLRVERGGRVLFERDLAALDHGQHAPAHVIHPAPLIEHTVSFVRLLGALATRRPEWRGEIELSLGLWQAEGWYLLPGGPPSPDWSNPVWEHVASCGDEAVAERTVISWDELRRLDSNQDPLAYRLLELLYEAFGHGPDRIPWWNVTTQRFELPV